MSSTRSTLLAAVALVVTFVAGIVVGVAGDRILLWKRPDRMRPQITQFMVKRLDQRLNLTPQQEVEVTRILKKHHERMGAVWSNVHPQLGNEIEKTNAEIRRVLTPEQRARFEGLKMRLMQRQERHGIRTRRE